MVSLVCIKENNNEILQTYLTSSMYLGTFDKLSIPPDTTISFMPSLILCAASIVAIERKREN